MGENDKKKKEEENLRKMYTFLWNRTHGLLRNLIITLQNIFISLVELS